MLAQEWDAGFEGVEERSCFRFYVWIGGGGGDPCQMRREKGEKEMFWRRRRSGLRLAAHCSEHFSGRVGVRHRLVDCERAARLGAVAVVFRVCGHPLLVAGVGVMERREHGLYVGR